LGDLINKGYMIREVGQTELEEAEETLPTEWRFVDENLLRIKVPNLPANFFEAWSCWSFY
jgi:hypothetical protein